MADKVLTLLDITKRDGTDQAVGLVEEVVTVAPELDQMLGIAINGITYKLKKRTVLPTSGFRNANEGSDLAASTYENAVGACYFLDVPLRVDEAVVDSGMAEGNSRAAILADEAAGALRSSLITVGDQFYRGTTANAKGFAGLLSLYDSTNCEVSATGSSGSATSAWLVWNDPQGVHFIWGNQRGIQMGEWQRQQVTDANSKAFMAWVNNCKAWIGLRQVHSRAVVRIKLITTASGKNLSDALVAEALSKMPIWMRRNSNLRLFCNSVAALTLQKSRSATTNNSATPLQFAPQPTESNGVPIVITDSIGQSE